MLEVEPTGCGQNRQGILFCHHLYDDTLLIPLVIQAYFLCAFVVLIVCEVGLCGLQKFM